MRSLYYSMFVVFFVFLSITRYESKRWCDNDVDTILVLDESGSVTEKSFNDYVIPFTKTFVEELHKEHGTSHIGVIKYSTVQKFFATQEYCIGATKYAHFPDIKLVHPLDGNYDQLLRDISKMNYVGGFTPTGHAIKEANEELIRHGREDVSKFVILVTDGDPRCDVKGGTIANDPKYAYEQAAILKERTDTILIIVEVGDQIYHEIDVEMASVMPDGSSFVFEVTDYSSLLRILDEVLEETCFEIEAIMPNMTCNNTSDGVITFDVVGNALTADEVICRLVSRNGLMKKDDYSKSVWEGKGEVFGIQYVRCHFNEDDDGEIMPEGIYDLFISFDSGPFLETELTFIVEGCEPEEAQDKPIPIDDDRDGQNGVHWGLVVGPLVGTCLLCCCLTLLLIFIAILILLLCYYCQYQMLERFERVDLSNNVVLKEPLAPKNQEPNLDPELEDIQIDDLPDDDDDDDDDDDGPIPDPPRQHPQYYINGRPVRVDWGEEGLSLDTPFRGGDMGLRVNRRDDAEKKKKRRRRKTKEEEEEEETETSKIMEEIVVVDEKADGSK